MTLIIQQLRVCYTVSNYDTSCGNSIWHSCVAIRSLVVLLVSCGFKFKISVKNLSEKDRRFFMMVMIYAVSTSPKFKTLEKFATHYYLYQIPMRNFFNRKER
jgi:hypothetical protein